MTSFTLKHVTSQCLTTNIWSQVRSLPTTFIWAIKSFTDNLFSMCRSRTCQLTWVSSLIQIWYLLFIVNNRRHQGNGSIPVFTLQYRTDMCAVYITSLLITTTVIIHCFNPLICTGLPFYRLSVLNKFDVWTLAKHGLEYHPKFILSVWRD